ncbi:LysE family translocator [Enterobacter cloacae]|uniref:LysE family translocator n=1 Tax=Klebsiella pneumoniae TaxID=573 RepID=UPI001083C903|nr:LysE family translocator [Klebsiella pneumoniae]ELG6444305.1 LysE family translocator [Enterobacter cloacae]VFZ29181.1 transporter [Klebsiella pneumoniae]
MDVTVLFAFFIVSASLALTPGADWAYVITSSMKENMLAPAVAGLALGYIMIAGVVAAGLGIVLANIPFALSVLIYCGAAYLIWMGIGAIRNPAVPYTGEHPPASDVKSVFIKGFVISGSNPKALLLFLAILPQFTRPDTAWPSGIQMGVLGLVHTLDCCIVYTCVGIGSKIILRSRPSAARKVSQFSGVAMITIAALLLSEKVLGITT